MKIDYLLAVVLLSIPLWLIFFKLSELVKMVKKHNGKFFVTDERLEQALDDEVR